MRPFTHATPSASFAGPFAAICRGILRRTQSFSLSLS